MRYSCDVLRCFFLMSFGVLAQTAQAVRLGELKISLANVGGAERYVVTLAPPSAPAGQDGPVTNPPSSGSDDERCVLVSVGNGGLYDAPSVSMELLASVNENPNMHVGIGLTGIFGETSPPGGLLADTPPHDNYQIVGESKHIGFGLYGVLEHRLIKGVDIRGELGFVEQSFTTVVQSNVTGWYYGLDTRTDFNVLLGGGLLFSNGLMVNYDNVRGVSGGMLMKF